MSTTSNPTSQRAVLFNTLKSTLALTTSAPVPTSASSSLLIRVHSTAITNGELTWAPFVKWPENHIPCYDVSGTVVSLPSDLTTSHNFIIGDRVYGRINAAREGAASEFASLLVSEAALVPKELAMQDAAVIPMSAHTAWQALFEHGLLTGSFSPTSVPHVVDDKTSTNYDEAVLNQAQGKRVLILGAAGGVGVMAVQMAKLAGAWVAGTAGPRNKVFLEELGVDQVIDYTRTSVKDCVQLHQNGAEAKFDLVLDCVGGKAMLDGWHGVKDHGTYISIVPGLKEPDEGKPIGVKSMWFVMESRGEELERIGKFFAKGLLKAVVDSVWKLEEYEKAFEKTGSGHARGKVVIRVGDE